MGPALSGSGAKQSITHAACDSRITYAGRAAWVAVLPRWRLIGALALLAACGRDPTGLNGDRALDVRFHIAAARSPLTTGSDGQLIPSLAEISRLSLDLYVVNTSASAPADTLRALKHFTVTAIGILGGGQIVFPLTFPLQGASTVYQLGGTGYDLLGNAIYRIGPGRFAERDALSPLGAHLALDAVYIGPSSNPPPGNPPPGAPPPIVATALQLVSGGGQSGIIGTLLANPVVVRLVSGTTPVSGATVTFSLIGGTLGSLTKTTATTDANGLASTGWTLGSLLGQQTLRASSAGVPSLDVVASGLPIPLRSEKPVRLRRP